MQFFRPTLVLSFCSLVWMSAIVQVAVAQDARTESNGKLVAADKPDYYWSFDEGAGAKQVTTTTSHASLAGFRRGAVNLGRKGPPPQRYPRFAAENRAAEFRGGYLAFTDSGPGSSLDFDLGDTITLEAWIQLDALANDQQVYIIGKGRTGNAGFASENQNYSLRVRGIGGTARLSFLFRNADNADRDDFHRWNSNAGFSPGASWHHVAVIYEFGKPESIRGVVDGREVKGSWDIGGPTEKAPVVDDDELWIGSALGGTRNCTLFGRLDDVALYRRAVAIERLKQRYIGLPKAPYDFQKALATAPREHIEVEIFEGLPGDTLEPDADEADDRFTTPFAGLDSLPHSYTPRGIRTARRAPFLVRMVTKRTLQAGEYEFLLRSRNASRLFVDDKLVGELPFMKRNASGHEAVPELVDTARGGLRFNAAGHQEKIVRHEIAAGEHLFRFETVVGGSGLRAELGEFCLAIAEPQGAFRVFAPLASSEWPLTDEGWFGEMRAAHLRMRRLDAERRRQVSSAEAEYWRERHQVARRFIQLVKPLSAPAPRRRASVDAYIDAKLQRAGVEPEQLVDDYEFLRRVTLDVVGRGPTRAEISELLRDDEPGRRERVIERLLADPGWADQWMGYWQDVLAENPGILKPKLNNTGPFRWWIYESLLDNKPMDRFVTELILMEGSPYEGGPAGFGMATQNDVPLAAKAHVLAQAFLGLEMKCARCHDSPYREFKQGELFSLAAMLNRQPLKLPGSSTVPQGEQQRRALITISLKPGDSISPHWPFAFMAPKQLAAELRDAADSREQLAALITSGRNRRFAQVIVNRIWRRYIGWGIVEPVDDWHEVQPSHPHLLDYLAREFVVSGYDMKHVARLILKSAAYQRLATAAGSRDSDAESRLFAAGRRRRLSAEQVVDSLFALSGKPISAEQLTLDPEGRRSSATFLNLGSPTRAWQFTSLSNERDRPALALPRAQTVVDVLLAFGWRDARPHPITNREEISTILQPLSIANGVVGNRATQLSDDSSFTELALGDLTVDQFVEQLFLQVLGRPPTSLEREPLAALLGDGFDERRTGKPRLPIVRSRNAVSWSNHLNAEATRIKLELERKVRMGDPPTARLQRDWRERAEDVVWALVNSPEFVFVP